MFTGYDRAANRPGPPHFAFDKAHTLKDIPGGVDAVVIATRPEVAEATMRECAELGIKHGLSPRITKSRPRARSRIAW